MVSILAARGAAALVRENTIEAFLAARQRGADGVELDVRATRDGALVVHHDPAIAGMAAPICDIALAELPEYVPVLADVLEACDGMVVNVEIKNWPHEPGFDPSGRLAEKVAAAVTEQRLATEVVISSFHLSTIDAVQAAEPSIRTAWLTLARYDQLDAVATAADRGHYAVHPFYDAIDADLVAAAHDSGVAVGAWTVAEPAAMVALAGMGVDTIITSALDVAMTTLRP